MKLNKQMIDNIKQTGKKIKEKVSKNRKEKLPKKYYTLLLLMLALGGLTLSNNIKEYKNSKKEEFKEYIFNEKEVDSNKVQLEKYITDESSISTHIPENGEEAIETISSNNEIYYKAPIKGEIVKEFAMQKLVYSETLGMWKTHPGIDIKANFGTKVVSSSNGIVQSVKNDSFYGNTVKILSEDGYMFVYSNLDNDIILLKGQKVKQGELIGKVGVSAAGELADECHLHFEIIKDEIQVNPLDFIN